MATAAQGAIFAPRAFGRGLIMLRVLWQTLFRGRYGFDNLSRLLLIMGLCCELIPLIFVYMAVSFLLQCLGFTLIALAMLRIFSRNVEARRREAQYYRYFCQQLGKSWHGFKKFLTRYFSNVGREERRIYKIVRCDHCRAQLRLPRGKGKVIAKCPRCGKKTAVRT